MTASRWEMCLTKGKQPLLICRFFAAAVTCALMSGCGETSSDLYVVTGRVTYQGKLVNSGFVSFVPDGRHGNRGPGGYASIANGRFQTERRNGIVGGKYVVKLTGLDGVPVEITGEGLSPSGRMLFEEHVVEVEFPTQDCEQNFDVLVPIKST